MENNKFGLEEVATNAVTTVTDSLLDSKDNKGTTLIIIGVGLAGLVGGWLGKVAYNKFKNRKDVTPIEPEVVDNGDRIVN